MIRFYRMATVTVAALAAAAVISASPKRTGLPACGVCPQPFALSSATRSWSALRSAPTFCALGRSPMNLT